MLTDVYYVVVYRPELAVDGPFECRSEAEEHLNDFQNARRASVVEWPQFDSNADESDQVKEWCLHHRFNLLLRAPKLTQCIAGEERHQ